MCNLQAAVCGLLSAVCCLWSAVVAYLVNMAEIVGSKKRGGRYCVAGGPNDVSCMNTSYTEGISMHVFPKDETTRRKWTRFVQRHRANFTAKSTSALCSAHFDPSCFERNISISLGDSNPEKSLKRYLKKGSIPVIDCAGSLDVRSQTPREKRQVNIFTWY